MSGTLANPLGRLEAGGDVLGALLRYKDTALEETGDHREVTSLVHRRLQRGTAADRHSAVLWPKPA
ncbi:hypothetical protein ACFXG6_30375 [Streptomyces roseus]|uniref:hypothetical protein n=1 Tax=Streptomyces roseus TaxID=66430 RepID=UPI003684D8B7